VLGSVLVAVGVYGAGAAEFLVEQDVGLVTVGVAVVVFYLVDVAAVAWHLRAGLEVGEVSAGFDCGASAECDASHCWGS